MERTSPLGTLDSSTQGWINGFIGVVIFSGSLPATRLAVMDAGRVVEEGAIADLLLVEGDPLADISLIANPQQNFRVILKDGRIYKNTVPGANAPQP